MVFLQFLPFIILLITANLAARASGWRLVTYVLLTLLNIAMIFFGVIFLILPALLAAQPDNPLNQLPFQPRWTELSLWMLALWLMLAAVWVGARLYRAAPTALPATFWSGALTTMLILLGPAIEDSANGEGVLGASVGRIAIFIGVALYAWATVWLSERWRAGRDVALAGNGV